MIILFVIAFVIAVLHRDVAYIAGVDVIQEMKIELNAVNDDDLFAFSNENSYKNNKVDERKEIKATEKYDSEYYSAEHVEYMENAENKQKVMKRIKELEQLYKLSRSKKSMMSYDAIEQGNGDRIAHSDGNSTSAFKIEHHYIKMRDGILLSTFVMLKINKETNEEIKGSATYATSPYGSSSDMFTMIFYSLNNHHAIIQDVRGTFLSQGNFSLWRSDGNDCFDTMQWITQQPFSNGKVYTTGISSDGISAITQLLNKPKWLKGQLLIYVTANAHKTIYPGGAFRQGLIEGYLDLLSISSHGYTNKYLLYDIIKHEEISDWWKTIDIDDGGNSNEDGNGKSSNDEHTVNYLTNVNWPIVHITGWYDIFLKHQLDAYDNIRLYGNDKFKQTHYVFVGALGHCLVANLNKDYDTYDGYGLRLGVEYASEMFQAMSNDDGPYGKGPFSKMIKKINIFVQGPIRHAAHGGGNDPNPPYSNKLRSNIVPIIDEIDSNIAVASDKNPYMMKDIGNYWSSFDEWPVYKTTKFYIQPDFDISKSIYSGATTSHSYIYNPADPIPTLGGNNFIIAFEGHGCGIMNQNKILEGRKHKNDTLIFTMKNELSEPLAITGKVKAVLYVSSDRNDTDFHVALHDVYPDGSSMLIRYGIQRMKWRLSTNFKSIYSLMNKGHIYQVTIDMWRTSYIFNPGHKLRIVISSSNYPYYSINDNSGRKGHFFREKDVKTNPIKATNTIHFSSKYPSHIELPVVDLSQLPRNELIGSYIEKMEKMKKNK